ncbi:Gfo/Idh/MocA family protein [Hoeflea ulvae]|uniref:Gfo/Idh/MocA family oxidoreductase n=1 Tax=Hoeflea ulvae TaxID=2983764 RepID=A0ABT3YHL1_9HYPH|nr:Gfo/Idh/MocA family oxidoreductase [Hoeflea ulvae]MCY0095392.1 Gfo/Idh/MocA family oxidoreductase [Hoeflea ulvae]
MQDIEPVRLVLIGLGMATRPHLEAFTDPACGVTVAGVYNRSRAKAEAVAERYGHRIFDTLEEIADCPEVEAVIVTTPPDQRREIVEMMAQAGKHILMEKPVERTSAAALQLVESCERHGVKLGIVFQHRFRAGAQRLASLVADKALGEIGLVRVEVPWWRDQAYYDEPGRGSFARDGGGVLISQAIHTLDLMLSLTGPARSVQALCATTRLHDMETEDFATAGVRFENGAVGSIVATTATFPGASETITLDGTLGTATLGAARLQVAWRDGRTEETGELSGTGGGADHMAFPCDWHKALIADFAAAIRSNRPPCITGREALKVHALIDAMIRSSAEGAVAPVASIADAP